MRDRDLTRREENLADALTGLGMILGLDFEEDGTCDALDAVFDEDKALAVHARDCGCPGAIMEILSRVMAKVEAGKMLRRMAGAGE